MSIRNRSSIIGALLLVIFLGSTAAIAHAVEIERPATSSQRVAAATGSAGILAAWKDANGQAVFIRSGTYNSATKAGFGMEKVRYKHGILSWTGVQFVTKNPNGGVAQGSDRTYTAYANKTVCDPKCKVVESLPVRAVMGNGYETVYYGVTINGAIGIKTAYCLNPSGANLCPSWVNLALTRSAPSEDGVVTTVDWSYEPLIG